MAVYAQDDERYVRSAFLSATTAQELAPTQMVVVQDGPVTDGVSAWLAEIEQDPRTTVVRIPTNMGLAAALNLGLTYVTTDIVARADADDICLPQRFARQIPVIESGFDLVGSAMAEFHTDPDHPDAMRPVKTSRAAILHHARLGSPFHHPTVVFRKQAVLKAGGYPILRQMEDYLLWAKMIMNGANVTNINEVLVCYRTGDGAFHRRGGGKLARSEAQLQREFLSMGFITPTQWVRNRLLRGPLYRYLPALVRRFGYHLWLRVGTWVVPSNAERVFDETTPTPGPLRAQSRHR